MYLFFSFRNFFYYIFLAYCNKKVILMEKNSNHLHITNMILHITTIVPALTTAPYHIPCPPQNKNVPHGTFMLHGRFTDTETRQSGRSALYMFHMEHFPHNIGNSTFLCRTAGL